MATSTIIAGAVTWTEELDGYLLATVTDARGKRHACAAPTGTPIAASIEDARRHGDGVAITALNRGIDLGNVHDPRPSCEAVSMETTWRTPRLGDTGPWGWMDRGNVVPLADAPAATPATALPLAA